MSRRRIFTPEEDNKIKSLYQKLGDNNWEIIAKKISGRTSKQCHDRYKNYLSSNRKTEPWCIDEDEILISMYHEIGPRWVAMCDILPGRSGNDIKNRWHKHLRKLDIFEIPDEREEEDNQEIFSSKIDDDSSDPLYISEKMNSYNEENDILKDMSINDDDIQELLNCFDENPSEMNE